VTVLIGNSDDAITNVLSRIIMEEIREMDYQNPSFIFCQDDNEVKIHASRDNIDIYVLVLNKMDFHSL